MTDAFFHCHVAFGSKCGGQSAVAKLAYLQRLSHYAYRGECAASESRNLPRFARGRALDFWAAADDPGCGRVNSVLYYEIEVGLQRLLSDDENLRLAREFAEELATDDEGKGHVPYTWAIHANDGNPHLHLMLASRVEDGLPRARETWFRNVARQQRPLRTGGACRWRAPTRPRWISAVRESWGRAVNRALERAGRTERADHRSHETRRLAVLPTVHLGWEHRAKGEAGRMANERRSRRVELNAQIVEHNRQVDELCQEARDAGLCEDLILRCLMDGSSFREAAPSAPPIESKLPPRANVGLLKGADAHLVSTDAVISEPISRVSRRVDVSKPTVAVHVATQRRSSPGPREAPASDPVIGEVASAASSEGRVARCMESKSPAVAGPVPPGSHRAAAIALPASPAVIDEASAMTAAADLAQPDVDEFDELAGTLEEDVFTTREKMRG